MACITVCSAADAGIDLLVKYPTKLTLGDAGPPRARSWQFTSNDVYQLSRFSFETGKDLQLAAGACDLGIGHCQDGALWAIVIPRQDGTLTSSAFTNRESISHIWLRFHPSTINSMFLPETVSAAESLDVLDWMRAIANGKITGSWQSDLKAMIPEPKDLTVDVDTKGGPRRFFAVDTKTSKVRYVKQFEQNSIKPPPAITPALAGEAFDQLWETYDKEYAMFVIRPEVDWAKLRDEFRPKAIAAKSSHQFAAICAEMLRPLRDLHIWMTVGGTGVPVFNRPRSSNANPGACREILGPLTSAGPDVEWAVTTNKIGYLVIYGWNKQEVPKQCHEALEKLRDTRGLIVDARLNGGGSENLALEVAGRFLDKPFVYAYSQFRNGPSHTNLTAKFERKVEPRGPWRYDRPVILLIGQICMSSNESFIAMMSGATNVVIMGDHTCGSSGNPRKLELPFDMTVSVPRWIDYLPDGTPLDERGFQPGIQFNPTERAFAGNRDDLLTAALERLSQAPLPGNPIP